jgi:uncharacterized protein (TIGR02996 family)
MAASSPLESVPIDPKVRSFFHAIKENPDDDTPRLIFADWLQERGNTADAARGEYLRLSVLRHRLAPDDPTYDLLKRREAELFSEHCWTWLGPLVDAARSWRFERGMIQISAQLQSLMTPEIMAWMRTEAGLWIDALYIREYEGITRWGQEPSTAVAQLASSPVLAHLNRLELSENPSLLVFFFRAALDTFALPFLTELLLCHNSLSTRELLILARYRRFPRLALLDLQHNRLDDAAARLLTDSPHLKNVAEIRLGHNRFTAEGIARLRQAFGDRVHF